MSRYDASDYRVLARCEAHARQFEPHRDLAEPRYFIPPSVLPDLLLCGACLAVGEVRKAGLLCTRKVLREGIGGLGEAGGVQLTLAQKQSAVRVWPPG